MNSEWLKLLEICWSYNWEFLVKVLMSLTFFQWHFSISLSLWPGCEPLEAVQTIMRAASQISLWQPSLTIFVLQCELNLWITNEFLIFCMSLLPCGHLLYLSWGDNNIHAIVRAQYASKFKIRYSPVENYDLYSGQGYHALIFFIWVCETSMKA